jgi:hypothetical protein
MPRVNKRPATTLDNISTLTDGFVFFVFIALRDR